MVNTTWLDTETADCVSSGVKVTIAEYENEPPDEMRPGRGWGMGTNCSAPVGAPCATSAAFGAQVMPASVILEP